VPTPLDVPLQDPAPWLAALDRLDVGELERLLASEHVGRRQ
jgi:hypothetical protein